METALTEGSDGSLVCPALSSKNDRKETEQHITVESEPLPSTSAGFKPQSSQGSAKDEEQNFMDFSENPPCKSAVFARPNLLSDKEMVYEATRSGQVLSEMHRFYQDKRFCDVVLSVEGCRFPCHRIVLAASSLYFERMFSNGMTEANAKEVTLNYVSAGALHHLIEFAYSSTLVVTKDTVLNIFEAADMLQFQTVREFCQDFLLDQIVTSNCLSFMLYADAYSSEQLYDKAKLCASANFKSICKTAPFMALPVNHLVALLAEDGLDMEYEEHVYETVRDWVLHDVEVRKSYMANLLKSIRFNFVSRWYLIEVISNDPLIVHCPNSQQVIQQAKDQLLALGHTYEFPWHLPPSRKLTGMTEKIVYLNTSDPTPGEAEVFLLDVVNKSWSNTSKPCPLASELSTCERYGDALLVIGGWTNNNGTKSLNQRGAVNIIHEFKVMSIFPNLWYVGAHCMGVARYWHSTTVVEGRLYLIGGFDENHQLHSSVLVADAQQQYHFEDCSQMLYPVSLPAVAQHQGNIYVFGGFGADGRPIEGMPVQMYNTKASKWCVFSPITSSSCLAYIYASFIDDLFYVFCGKVDDLPPKVNPMVGHPAPVRCIDSIYTFEPVTKAWQKTFTFTEPRTGNFSMTTLSGRVYITGGSQGAGPRHAVECYDPRTNSLELIGNTREGPGSLSLCTTMTVMHENFGL